jgi:polynucleotide 5'-kinase involved in rRNA processing
LIDATHQLLALAGDDVIVQCFDYRSQPILHQTLLMIACLLRPERFLVGTGMLAGEAGLPIGPEEVDLPVQHELVRSAQRKAQWMKLVEQCEQHIVSLDEVTLDGARLGAGAPLSASDCDRLHLPDVQYAELAGGTLLVISSETPDSAEVARALDIAHATRAVFAAPEHYRHLLCGFAKASGEDFGIGMIQSIDFRSREAEILCTAVSPAPVRTLKFGSLRVTNQGHELGEVKPWAV